MLRGNISNQQSFTIGFRCENSLLEYRDNNIGDKFLNALKGKTYRAEINPKVKSIMDYIYWNTEYTVVLIIDKENYTKEAEKFFLDFPFNQVFQVINNVSEITMMLNTGVLTYFVTNNKLDRERVNSRYAIDVDSLNTILRRRVKRFEEN